MSATEHAHGCALTTGGTRCDCGHFLTLSMPSHSPRMTDSGGWACTGCDWAGGAIDWLSAHTHTRVGSRGFDYSRLADAVGDGGEE